MKVSLNWLKEYVDLSGISVEDIVHKLSMAGLEVEEVFNELEIYKDFVVGLVSKKEKHPNADKLSICKVSTGNDEYQVICGAPNVEAGQKIVFAPIGATIPKGNFKIGKAKIRGVESFGMICSEAELELSDNHSGIMVLVSGIKEGTPLTDALNLNDVIMEIAVTPNRPDALSHFGVARDLAALFNKSFKIPQLKFAESEDDVNKFASIEIVDTKNCPRYSGRVVRNVEIKESPEWLKNRLTKVGLRPINNIVDVTNYVMYETGQPLHAFDLDKLNGSKIIVKSTDTEESFTTLDSKARKLPQGTLMICDEAGSVAIAGVMGGENSEVTYSTKNILIESAFFNPVSIRRTSKQLSLSTDASYRFERGTDPGNTVYAAERAAQLIADLSGGKIPKGVIDVYPVEVEKRQLTLRLKRIKQVLGYEISASDITQILTNLGLEVTDETSEEIKVSVPTFRSDLEREIDLIEEIARIYGYDNIPTIEKISISLDHRFDDSEFIDQIKTTANALGFYEMINNPLVSEKNASLIGNKIPLLNPKSLDMAYLRTSLVPGALEVIARNINYGEKNLALFEAGNVFNKISDDGINTFDDFTEKAQALFIITGNDSEKEWFTDETPFDFYRLKGLINSLTKKISLDNVLNDSYYFGAESIYEYYFVKKFGNTSVGKGGKISKEVLKKFDIDQPVYSFEFDLDELKKIRRPEKKYIEPPKFPKIIRDFAFIFDSGISYKEVIDYIKSVSSNLLQSVKIFDLFESGSLGKNKKSMAFTLEYFSKERTLTDEEVEKDFMMTIASVTKKFNATLRGK